MARNVITKQYRTTPDKAVQAVTIVVPRLGYTLRNVDSINGLVNFESGTSMWSNKGEAMTTQVVGVSAEDAQVTITGIPKGTMSIIDMALNVRDAEVIATKVFLELDTMLGTGTLISGNLNTGSRRTVITFAIIALLLLFLCLVVFVFSP